MACNEPHRDDFGAGNSGKQTLQITLGLTRTMRERRNEFFDPELFSDPAWDIMLLLANEPSRDGFSAAEIAATFGYPPSITNRWLKILVSKGQVETSSGEEPLHRLSEGAFAAMVNVFAGVVEADDGDLAA